MKKRINISYAKFGDRLGKRRGENNFGDGFGDNGIGNGFGDNAGSGGSNSLSGNTIGSNDMSLNNNLGNSGDYTPGGSLTQSQRGKSDIELANPEIEKFRGEEGYVGDAKYLSNKAAHEKALNAGFLNLTLRSPGEGKQKTYNYNTWRGALKGYRHDPNFDLNFQGSHIDSLINGDGKPNNMMERMISEFSDMPVDEQQQYLKKMGYNPNSYGLKYMMGFK